MKTVKMKPLLVFLTTFIGLGGLNAESVDKKIKEGIDEVSDVLKALVDECKGDLVEIQDRLNEKWNHLVEETIMYDALTLKQLHLNGHSRVVVVRPGEKIRGSIICDLDRSKCDSFSFYRVVLGMEDEKAQTTIGNEFGLFAGESLEEFTLVAPQEPGIYQLRFKLVKSIWEATAMEAWKEDAPGITKTIGIIIVSSK